MVRSQVRWLKHILMAGLLIAAAAIALNALFGDHSDDYGKVDLSAGGVVHLPKGTVTAYYAQSGTPTADQSGGLSFQAVPVAGGSPLAMSSPGGTISAEGTQRSESIGDHGAIAKLDVPADGEYRIVTATNMQPGLAQLEFGTTAAKAVAARWKELAVLVGLAFLIALIPTPRHGGRRRDDPEGPDVAETPSGWSSSTQRAPYAG